MIFFKKIRHQRERRGLKAESKYQIRQNINVLFFVILHTVRGNIEIIDLVVLIQVSLNFDWLTLFTKDGLWDSQLPIPSAQLEFLLLWQQRPRAWANLHHVFLQKKTIWISEIDCRKMMMLRIRKDNNLT